MEMATRWDREALFGALAGGLEAGVTVVTPNHRLAQSLLARFEAWQRDRGLARWEAPDILPLPAFLQRVHEDSLYVPGEERAPRLLTPDEERLLWEEAVRASRWGGSLLAVPATAALAAQAWSTAHAWRIEGAVGGWPGNEDAEAFVDWMRRYERRTATLGAIDGARLPVRGASLFARRRGSAPRVLVFHAFDLPTPRQADLIEACTRAGISVVASDPPAHGAEPRRVLVESPRRELELAARWARSRLEAARGSVPRIAIVVPDLEARREEAIRVFARVLPRAGSEPLFNLSIGAPLSSHPLVDAALGLLALAHGPVAFDRASRLLRSPFVAGAEPEREARARLDAALRSMAPHEVALERWLALAAEASGRRGAPACPRWRSAMKSLAEASRAASRAGAPEWARRFTAALDAAGFPGERSLDATEHQALEAWREALGDFAALGSLAPAWGATEARSRLARLAADRLFQPATGTAPVQVLGLLESAGLDFDHLWVSGLTEDAWPVVPRPEAFIPPALQRHAGIPQASPEASLEVDRRITEGWRRAAPEVVFSSARAEGDRDLVPSPLAAVVPRVDVEVLGIPAFETARDALHAAGRTADGVQRERPAPAVAEATVAGGTSILADQAACPFRAFARFRLDARGLERPEPGLGPAERGQLLHAMMAQVWSRLRDQATLKGLSREALRPVVEESAARAVAEVKRANPGRLEGRFEALERERVAALALDWLDVERDRAVPFTVREREEAVALHAGPIALRGRVDRIDELEGGGVAILDYKTGEVSVGAWFGERPDDAQLPLYALASREPVRAVAYAKLRVGAQGFSGVSREGTELPGVATVEKNKSARERGIGTWSHLFTVWREQVGRLGEAFAAGESAVDPKHDLVTCRRCDLKPLCRVHERLGGDGGDE